MCRASRLFQGSAMADPQALAIAQTAVHRTSQAVPKESVVVEGCDFDRMGDTPPIDGPDRLSQLLGAFRTSGFQATKLAAAIEEVHRMRSWQPEGRPEDDPEQVSNDTPGGKYNTSQNGSETPQLCKIFLGYTSNQVSCGNRDIIRYLVQHKMVHVLVTTAGGIEEDIIKCLHPTILGDFALDGRTLRAKGLNRIGNLLVPNLNYCAFEDWLVPVLDRVVKEQTEKGTVWSPSSLISRLGETIADERSICYWAWRNKIPIFCPAITDGSLGDMIYFHSYRQDPDKQLVLDLVQDIRALNNEAVRAPATGIICLGGGLVKHHICNANLMRNGAEFAVFINTGQEFDGSDSGASPDEAISWGKIKPTSSPVKVNCDASLAFPLLVAETFAKHLIDARHRNQRTISDSLYL